MKGYTSKQASFIERVQRVFEIKNLPTVTYIPRRMTTSENTYEDRLCESILRGDFCLITGPSKTGKTCLFKNVIQKMKRKCIIIRCDQTLTSTNIWSRACEELNYERISKISKSKSHKTAVEGSIEGKVGLSLLSFLSGKFTAKHEQDRSVVTFFDRITAVPSYYHLLPILQELQYILVFDDFHKLNGNEASALLEQFKNFSTEKVPVIATCNSHNIIDQVKGHSIELVGRFKQIKLSIWDDNDLIEILIKGFKHLRTPLPPTEILELIANRSVGLPMITQAVALNLFEANLKGNTIELNIDQESVTEAFRAVVTDYYSPLFEPFHSRLIRGQLSEASRNAYQHIIGILTLNPPDSPLRLEDIYEQVKGMRVSSKKPTKRSITAALKRLNEIQATLGINLLRWSPQLAELEVLEPSFIFYLNYLLEFQDHIAHEPDDILKLVLEARHDADDGTNDTGPRKR